MWNIPFPSQPPAPQHVEIELYGVKNTDEIDTFIVKLFSVAKELKINGKPIRGMERVMNWDGSDPVRLRFHFKSA